MTRSLRMLCALLLAGSANADAPGWPPPLESLRNGDACAERPACDVEAPADEVTSALGDTGRFVRVLNTTASDCSSVVALTDPRAKLGNVTTEPLRLRFEGSCVLNGGGKVIGAVRDGVMATCQQTSQPFGAVALETAVVDLAPSGEGRARVPVLGLPWLLAGQSACEIALDVRIRELEVAPTSSAAP